jgi:hypothetical protein
MTGVLREPEVDEVVDILRNLAVDVVLELELV